MFLISVLHPYSDSPFFLMDTFASHLKEPCDISPSEMSKKVTIE